MRRVTYQGIVCPYSLLTALDSRVCDEMEREREMKIEVELETVSYTDRRDNGVSTTAD